MYITVYSTCWSCEREIGLIKSQFLDDVSSRLVPGIQSSSQSRMVVN